MASQNQQALLSYDDDQPQAQLRRDEVGQGETQNSTLLNQTGDSMKTMAYGASGAARGAMGFAQGAAMGAANLAQGAATAMKNTFANNQHKHDLHTPLPTANPHNHRY